MSFNYSKFINYGGKKSLYKEIKAATEKAEKKQNLFFKRLNKIRMQEDTFQWAAVEKWHAQGKKEQINGPLPLHACSLVQESRNK